MKGTASPTRRLLSGCFAIGVAASIAIPAVRRRLYTRWLLEQLRGRRLLPAISETEQAALQAGDVWIEREFFSGRPDLRRISSESYPELTPEERVFLEGPVEKLCGMVEDWRIWRDRDLPAAAWEYIAKARFWGMIIPKRYGGLGFSSLAHSEVIQKLASRSIPLSITVMVPNSLGPAELLIRYGTEEQKEFYLPRLARGEEIPCFALTEPRAGSDAASIRAEGTVFKGVDGELYLNLNWNKRWITLAAVSTLLGIAFRLKDPENLLGKGEDVGITCALVPTHTQGVVINRRHDPLGVPFYNSPTQGRDVIVPIGNIIGGPSQAGSGWRMLMEALAAGRGISLPAQSTGGAKYTTRVVSARAVVREQFSSSIGRFEGVDEALAPVAGFTYLLEALRRFTCGAIDRGVRPPIITAIAKYHSTELNRKIFNRGMDILGGQGITLGPRNLLAHGYIAAPIAITVEGANILTRSLIIFGQGAVRAHPFVLKELTAARANDLVAFDRALWSHAGSFGLNLMRTAFHGLTRGHAIRPPTRLPTARYWQKLGWASAQFALLTDLHLVLLGSRLKKLETVSGRFADVLSWLVMISAVLRRYEAEGARPEDLPFVSWCADHGFARIQAAFEGIFSNSRIPVFGPLLRIFGSPLSAINSFGRGPSDRLTLRIAALAQAPGAQRESRLTGGIFIPSDRKDPFHVLERAYRATLETEPARARIRAALKQGSIERSASLSIFCTRAVEAGIVSPMESSALQAAENARLDAIQVDDFSFEDYRNRSRSRKAAA